ncbi:MAG: hypothetical protein QXE64_00960 [Candidatus Pacearchaeota archaeon]
MDILEFKSGKWRGKSLEQLAVTDYPSFRWLYENGNLPDRWKARMEKIIYALDNFESKIKCQNPNCCNPAEYLSIVVEYSYGYSGYGSRSRGKAKPIADIGVSTDYVFCSPKCSKNSHLPLHEKAILYEAKYSVIFSEFSPTTCNKGIREDLHNVMYKLLAGEMEKTKKNLYNLINKILESLEAQRQRQLSFNF